MARVFLSPSTQEYNLYVDGSGSEEYWMNRLADAIEPFLTASGIQFGRNDPSLTVGGSVRLSNAGNYDLHVALHSNASGPARAGQQRGIDIYYYDGSAESKRAADLIVEQLKKIYPNPDLVRALPTTSLYELNNTIAPAVLAELGYHDNLEDAKWIQNNIYNMASAISSAIAAYFGVPFRTPGGTTQPTQPTQRTGTVVTQGGRLNIRSGPSMDANIIGQIPNGQTVTVLSQSGNWYRINYNGIEGYVSGQFLRVQ
ncbi:MAG TPA: SH3 domain-containing protein [Bacillota bacterium]|nr:SH3 domain-containing protein [Bacillota bacterium]